jgi:amino acid transporter, AAT family
VGNVVLGTALHAALLGVCSLLVGPANTAQLGDTLHQFPAQLGVCRVVWMIIWGNAFGNRPTGTALAGYAARAGITFGLAVGTFCLYYDVLAKGLLHEPAAAGNLSGNALGFMDWLALVTLLYVVGFESFGIPRPRTDEPATTSEPLVSH